jgi:mono/diheme cytochrome c family protein
MLTPMATAFAPRLAALWLALTAVVAPAAAQTRGELLYATHCVACHNEQMHWRDKKQAVDWASLKAQVELWQATGMLSWNQDDVLQVTRHLNDTYYRFDAPPASGAGPTASRWQGLATTAALRPR